MGLFDLSKLIVSAIDNLEATLDSMVEMPDKVIESLEKFSNQTDDVSKKVVRAVDKVNKTGAIPLATPQSPQNTQRSINGIERKGLRTARSAPPCKRD